MDKTLTVTEKIKRYRPLVQQVIERHAGMPTEPVEPESVVVIDPVHDHYLLMDVGWEAGSRAHYIVIHLRLKDGKVWIEEDGIEYGIARDLIAAGITAEDILVATEGVRLQPLPELAAA